MKKILFLLLTLVLLFPTFSLDREYLSGSDPASRARVYNRAGNLQRVELVAVEDDILVRDSIAPVFEVMLEQELNPVVVVGDLTKGQQVLTFQAGHNFSIVTEDYFTYYWFSQYTNTYQMNQISVSFVDGNDITLGTPITENIPNANISKSTRVNIDMAVNGSITPVVFKLEPPQGITWLCARMVGTMLLDTQPDDGLFGDIAKLTNGCYFGIQTTFVDALLGDFKENADFRRTAFDVSYNVRSGGQGTWGESFRKSFNGADKYGAVLPLDYSIGGKFIGVVQDNLTSLVQFRIVIMGKEDI